MAARPNLPSVRAALSGAAGALRYEHTILFFFALVVGAAAGYAAIGFRWLVDFWGRVAFGTTEERLIAGTVALDWWHILLAPMGGGIIVALALRFSMPRRRPEAMSEVIEAVALRDGRMDIRSGLANVFVNATALGFGSSIGREGPVVHLGATLASFLSQRLNLTPAVMRTLVGCGVAAAVAASFNAPIAGVIFALEVVVGHYALHAFAPIVIASVTGTIIVRIELGNFPAFTVPDMVIVSFWEFPAFAAVGVVGAGVAIVFMSAIFYANTLRDRFAPLPEWALPPLGGLAVGAIAIWIPEAIGVGYEGTDNALKSNYALETLLILLAAKILATALSIGLRFGTGVFSASLFVGAMAGGACGIAGAVAFPDLASTPGLYAIVGMGAVASAVLGAPISTILIVFELTGDYEVTIAVMIASALASLITHAAYKPSFFLAQLERRGLSLEEGKASHLLKSTRVKAVMQTEINSVHRGDSIETVRQRLLRQGGGKLMVVDDDEALTGVVTLAELPEEAWDPELRHLINAGDVARGDPAFVYGTDTLEKGLRMLERTGEHVIPVLSGPEERKVIGLLDHEDVLKAYTRALLDSQGRLTSTPR